MIKLGKREREKLGKYIPKFGDNNLSEYIVRTLEECMPYANQEGSWMLGLDDYGRLHLIFESTGDRSSYAVRL